MTAARAAVAVVGVAGLAGLIGLGTGKLAQLPLLAGAMAVVLPVLVVYGVLLGLVIRALDRWRTLRRGPVLVAVVWGGLVAIPLAGIANRNLATTLEDLFGGPLGSALTAPLAAPLTEETLKVLGVLAAVALAGRLAGPVEAMLLGAVSGLGFQLVENVGYLHDAALWNPDSDLAGAGGTLLGRALGGLDGHWVYSALCGLAVGLLLTRAGTARRRVVVGALLLAAIGLHLVNNSTALLGLPEWSLLIEAPLTLLVLWTAHRYAVREQWRRAVARLAAEPGPVGTEDERIDLRTRRTSRAARRATRRAHGRDAGRARGRLQRAQVALATAGLQGRPDEPARAATLRHRDDLRTAEGVLVSP